MLLEKHEIPRQKIESVIDRACKSATELNILGKNLTPYLLKEIKQKTGGNSLKTNKLLALNNISLGINIVKEMA